MIEPYTSVRTKWLPETLLALICWVVMLRYSLVLSVQMEELPTAYFQQVNAVAAPSLVAQADDHITSLLK
jgi:hypothetical protein